MPSLALIALLSACADQGPVAAPSPDIGSQADQSTCDARRMQFEDFVASHRGCVDDDDCSVVGSCVTGNADFRAVRADALTEASRLMEARCHRAFDGPTFVGVCNQNECGLSQSGACGQASNP